MIRAVFDTNLLVSAFLTRHHPGGVSTELLRFVEAGALELCLSRAIIEEAAATLVRSERLQARYSYTRDLAVLYCAGLFTVATLIDDPPPLPSPVCRDPDDDMIIACAVAAQVPYLVTRDLDLLDLGIYGSITMISPEVFLRGIRADSMRQ